MRFVGALFLCAFVAGCGSDPFAPGKSSFVQSKSFMTTSGKITIPALSGYCFDDAFIKSSSRVHLAVLGGCGNVSKGFSDLRLGFEPLVISTKIARRVSNIPEDQFIQAAKGFAGVTAQKGYKVLGAGDHLGAIILDVDYGDKTPLKGVKSRAWIAVQHVNGHLVTHSVFRGAEGKAQHRATISTVKRLIQATLRAND